MKGLASAAAFICKGTTAAPPATRRAATANGARRRAFQTASGGGVDLVVEVAGSPSAIPQGMEALRPGGTYVWAGMVHPETTLALTGEEVVRKCLTIRGVHNYAPPDLASALKFLTETQHRFPYRKLVSPPLPLAQLGEAVELARRREWLRVSVRP